MEKIYIVLLVLAVGICFTFTKKSSSVFKSYGILRVGKDRIPGLSHNGSVYLDGTIVTEPIHINGSLDARRASFESLNLNGSALLYDCTFNGQVQIFGSIKAGNSTFNESMTVNSKSMQFDSCKINGLNIKENLRVNGIQINSSKINELNIRENLRANGIQLNSCKIYGLNIEENHSVNGIQTVVLQHGTIVTGPIEFESKNGEVIIDATSECGMVMGGKIIHK